MTSKRLLVGTAMVLAVVAGMAAVLVQSASAQDAQAATQRAPMGREAPGEGGMPWAPMDGPQKGDGRYGQPDGIDRDGLLAEALGITVEQLRSARQKAEEAAIGLMRESGAITDEQAELLLARLKVCSYLDPETLRAEALGISVEELQAAREAGKSERDLMDELGIDRQTYRDNLRAARDRAIDRAVADGVITAEQAAALKDGGGMAAGSGQRGGMRGHGGPDWQVAPEASAEDGAVLEGSQDGLGI